jgi:hypothetical protein
MVTLGVTIWEKGSRVCVSREGLDSREVQPLLGSDDDVVTTTSIIVHKQKNPLPFLTPFRQSDILNIRIATRSTK